MQWNVPSPSIRGRFLSWRSHALPSVHSAPSRGWLDLTWKCSRNFHDLHNMKPMSIISYTIWGLASRARKVRMRLLLENLHLVPDVTCLQEHKLRRGRTDQIRGKVWSRTHLIIALAVEGAHSTRNQVESGSVVWHWAYIRICYLLSLLEELLAANVLHGLAWNIPLGVGSGLQVFTALTMGWGALPFGMNFLVFCNPHTDGYFLVISTWWKMQWIS